MTRRPDGRWQASTTINNKRVFVYGLTRNECQRKLDALKTRINDGPTLNEVADEWWEIHEPTIAYQTAYSYKPCMTRILDYLGDYQIKEITNQLISSTLVKLSNRGFSRKTLATHKLVLNLIFTYALTQDYIQVNNVPGIPLPKTASKPVKRSAIPEHDEQLILDAQDEWLFPLFILGTGLRKGEALALQWQDINSDITEVNVTKSLYWENGRSIIKDTKTANGNRTVPIPEQIRKRLKKMKHKKTDYVFSKKGSPSEPMTKRGYLNACRTYESHTGVKVEAHRLRHSYATIGVEIGIQPKTMQSLMGHADIQTTLNIYADSRASALSDAAEKITEKLKEKQG